jgi:hypothetical protein
MTNIDFCFFVVWNVWFWIYIIYWSSIWVWKNISAKVCDWKLKLNLNFSFVWSYPYSEEHDEARSYLRARCPAWCDRILLSNSFKNFIINQVFNIRKFFFSVSNQIFSTINHRIISLEKMFVWVIIRLTMSITWI